jgi:conjugal transfer pilus assembly protein TraB
VRDLALKAWRLVRQRPGVGILLAVLGAVIVWTMARGTTPPLGTREREPARGPQRLLSPEVELRGELQQLRDDNARLRKDMEELRQLLERAQKPAAAPQGRPGGRDELSRLFEDVPRTPPPTPSPPPAPPAAKAPAPPAAPPPPPAPAPPRLTRFTVSAPQAPAPPAAPAAAPARPAAPKRAVYLPPGSFVDITLLSGVYAPVRGSQPLPVLVHLDEAAVGPNRSRVPVERCFAIAKALGDYQSRRAILQLDQLSCVLPDGQAFTAPLAGWVSGRDGILGIPGTLEEHTGPYLARVAMGALLQGVGSGLAQAQTTVTTTPLGGNQTIISGNDVQYALMTGLAQIGQRMASFYERQLESLVPTITVPAGARGSAVLQAGVSIEGLTPVAAAEASPWRSLD